MFLPLRMAAAQKASMSCQSVEPIKVEMRPITRGFLRSQAASEGFSRLVRYRREGFSPLALGLGSTGTLALRGRAERLLCLAPVVGNKGFAACSTISF